MCSASRCAIAHASARPSNVDVPRPISSISTRLCARRAIQDVRRLGHLDHERRAAAGEVVGGADARVDRIERPERRARRRHEHPAIREQRDDRRLAHVRRLAAHVRTGDDQQPPRGVERDVVGNERSTCRSTTGAGPPSIAMPVSRAELRAREPQRIGALGERRQHVERRERASDASAARAIAGASCVSSASYRRRSQASARSCAVSAFDSNALSSGVM